MSRREFLELLQDLIRESVVSITHPDDHSGAFTKYLVDQEALLSNIAAALEKEPK